jgi:hypothetical protein
MDGRELKSGGAEAFARGKVGEGNETSGWIAGRERGRERPSAAGFEPSSLVRRHSKTISKTPTK